MATNRATPRNGARSSTGKRKPKANTEAIVGSATKELKIPAKWKEYYRQLVKMRDELKSGSRRLVTQARELKHRAHGDNIADAGTDTYDQDFALSMASSEQQALFEIEEALSRIKTGRYGICEATGKPVDAARLAAIPWTRFSAEAERDLEAKDVVARARLADRGDLPHSAEASSEDNDAEQMGG